MQVPGMTAMMSGVNTSNVTGTYGPGYMAYILQVCYRSWTQGNDHNHATRPKLHCTAREEVKLVMQWKKEMFHRGRRAVEK